jgi:TolB protein
MTKDADGRNVKQLTHTMAVCYMPSWVGNRIVLGMHGWRSDPDRMKKIYREKPGDKRPVWVIRPDGSEAHVVEWLRYQCAMHGSRAAWKPFDSPR